METIKFDLKGKVFETKKSNVLKYPNSYFYKVYENNSTSKTEVISINRDNRFFEYILNFLEFGILSSSNLDSLTIIKNEAFFYGLQDLVDLCNKEINLKLLEGVKINVGGTIFQSSRQTYFKSSYIKRIFKEFEGNEDKIFIDLNSDYFSIVLDYLRIDELITKNEFQYIGILKVAEILELNDLFYRCQKYLRATKRYEIKNVHESEYDDFYSTKNTKLINVFKKNDKEYDFVFEKINVF